PPPIRQIVNMDPPGQYLPLQSIDSKIFKEEYNSSSSKVGLSTTHTSNSKAYGFHGQPNPNSEGEGSHSTFLAITQPLCQISHLHSIDSISSREVFSSSSLDVGSSTFRSANILKTNGDLIQSIITSECKDPTILSFSQHSNNLGNASMSSVPEYHE